MTIARRSASCAQALQVRPNTAILGYTFLSIAAWAVLWTLFVYFNQGEIIDHENGSFLAPKPVLTLLALLAPIVFIFVTGVMARRAHEMKQVANSMAEVAIRLIEPETIATEQMVTLSQAIRREAASMGDGIERALARASELEIIVRTEVSNLERSYSENERRIRVLIDELTREREAILVNADNARTALLGARESLSEELQTTSSHLAETVSEAGGRVTAALGSKGEEIRLALERVGDGFNSTLSTRGEDMVQRLSVAGETIAASLNLASEEVTRRFSDGIAEADRRLQERGEALAADFESRGVSVVERLD